MARIIATGVPAKYPELGEIRVIVDGTDVEIENVSFEIKNGDDFEPAPFMEELFDLDMKKGPEYPLCADPETMRCALFILFAWFGEEHSCWIKEPEHVKIEGEIEPMESEPGVIY